MSEPKKRITIRWTEDPFAERVCRELELPGQWGYFPLAEIDQEESLKNMGRPGEKVNDENAATFAIAMQEGGVFPGCVIWQPPHAKAINAGGNTREKSTRTVKDTHLYAFIIKEPLDERKLRILTAKLNMANGFGLDTPERIEMALRLISNDVTEAMASKILLLKPSRLKDAIRTNKVRVLCREHNVSLNGIPDRTISQLHSIIQQVPVLLAVAGTIKSCALTSDLTKTLLAELKGQPDEGSKLRAVAAYAQQYRRVPRIAQAPGKTASQTPLQKFTRDLRSVDRLLQSHATIDSFGPFPDEAYRENIRLLMRELSSRLYTASHSFAGG